MPCEYNQEIPSNATASNENITTNVNNATHLLNKPNSISFKKNFFFFLNNKTKSENKINISNYIASRIKKENNLNLYKKRKDFFYLHLFPIKKLLLSFFFLYYTVTI